MSKAGAAGATVTFALTAGSLPPGLTMPAQSGSGTVITGNPTQAGTFNFTVKATDGGLTSTLAYQITVTVQGPPDQLLCNAANGGFLISGVCVLPDAVVGQPYQGHLPTSHNAGGTLSIVAGALPPGLSLPATFGPSGAIVGGTPGQPGIEAQLRLHRARHRRPGPAPVSGLLDHGGPERAAGHQRERRINPRSGDGRRGVSRRTSSSAAEPGPTPGPLPPGSSRPA